MKQDLKQLYSGIIGLVGGLVDLIAGVALVRPTMMMDNGSSIALGYFLLLLGAVVLATGLYSLTSHMMRRGRLIGQLMLVYGLIMLILGTAMWARLFPMMQGSFLSGAVMLATGAAMLYSGYGMVKM